MNYTAQRQPKPVALTAAEGNRKFSAVLRAVRAGKSFVITSHGRPVAKIVPFDGDDRRADTVRDALFSRLRRARVRNVAPWRREDLYEDVR